MATTTLDGTSNGDRKSIHQWSTNNQHKITAQKGTGRHEDTWTIVPAKDELLQEKALLSDLHAGDILETLNTKFAYLSGGRVNGSPIIIFPSTNYNFDPESDDNQTSITQNELQKLLRYLMQCTSVHDRENRFVLIMDRRRISWSTTKLLLRALETLVLTEIEKIYVMKPPKTYKKRLAEIGRPATKQEFALNVISLYSLDDLHNHIPIDQLPAEMNGAIQYDHDAWILHRMKMDHLLRRGLMVSNKLENFASQTSVECENILKHGRLSEDSDESADHIEDILNDKRQEQEQLIKDLDFVITDIESFQDTYTDKRTIDDVFPNNVSVEFLATLSTTKNLLAQLDETKVAFVDLWQNKASILTQHFQRCNYETSSAKLIELLKEFTRKLSQDIEVGDSIKRTKHLLHDLKQFERNTHVTCERVMYTGDEIRQLLKRPHYAADQLRTCLNNLLTASQEFSNKSTERAQNLKATLQLQECIDEIQEWCNAAVTLLAKQIDDFESESSAEEWVQKLQDCMDKMNQFNVTPLLDTREKYKFIADEDIHNQAVRTLQRYLEVKGMCSKRRNTMRKIVKRRGSIKSLIGQSPQPRDKMFQSFNADEARHQVVADNSNTLSNMDERKPRSSSSSLSRSDSINRISRTSSISSIVSIPSTSEVVLNCDMDVDVPRRRPTLPTLASPRISSALLVENLQESLLAIIENEVDTETDCNVLKQRGQIVNELIETERAYINDLRSVIKGYYDEMLKPGANIPRAIHGKKNILFGNIRQIYNFHHKVFLKNLELHHDMPALVGRCFTAKKNEFKMYTAYCKNRPSSESLWEEIGGLEHPFFNECQRALNHQLPLNSYLIKPVQRITKYGLLLRDLLKHTSKSPCGSADLKDALDFLKILLKQSNDVMHQIAIKGFKGNLAEQGDLLLQGLLQVCEVNKRGLRISVRRHKTIRQVFLYEKLILFTKKQEEVGEDGSKKHFYKFKSDLKTCDIGLTEAVKNQPLAFEIWVPGQPKVYVIQAYTPEAKETWTTEIRRVLFKQLRNIRGIVNEQVNAQYTYLHPGDQNPDIISHDERLGSEDEYSESESISVIRLPLSDDYVVV